MKVLSRCTGRFTCCTLILATGHLTACSANYTAQTLPPDQARNVIIFIGDGMGVSTVTATRILEGQLLGKRGEEHVLSWETFPQVALSKTYNTNQQVSDSAGTATAMFTGVKTKAGVISVGPEVVRRDCQSTDNIHLTTAFEMAETAGLATGLVSTARITHATPAAAYAHSPERAWEVDTKMPPQALEQGCKDIALQLIDFAYGDGIDVVMGGGRSMFMPNTVSDPEYPKQMGLRGDGRNLIDEWLKQHPQSTYIWNQEQFDTVGESTQHLLALFQPSHMNYEVNRADDSAGEPSLAQMTAKSIELLRNKPAGFLLLVEAGRIDHGHHTGVAAKALHDGIALAQAVKVADAMTDDKETLIIVTADHSHVFTIGGYPTRGNPILGHVKSNDLAGNPSDKLALAEDGKPYTTLGYHNGRGAWQTPLRPNLIDVDVTHTDYRQQAAIALTSETHGGEDVAIYAKGPGAQRIHGVMEQNRIFDVIVNALQLTPKR